MRFVFSDDYQPEIIEGMCRWAAPRIGTPFDPTQTSGIAVQCDHGSGVVLYTNWQPKVDIRMHVCGVGQWLSRAALAIFFGFPFQDLDLQRVTGLVNKKNRKARAFDEKLGFRLEGCIRKGAQNGDDLMVYGMLRSECRWLKEMEDGWGQGRRLESA